MQIRVQCPACEASFEVPAALVGRDGECSRCQKVFRVTPLSGEVDRSILSDGDSAATLEMPVVAEEQLAPDTDEFDIPEIPAPSPKAAEPLMPELDVPELDIPERDLPAPTRPGPQKKGSAAELPMLDVKFETAQELQSSSVLIEDDGSLFGDEIPELEHVREPVSRYASEDGDDPDAGGSYSPSGRNRSSESSPSPEKRKAKHARRRKATKKKAAARRSQRLEASEGDRRATSDHDVGDAEVQLFDDVLHDDDVDDDAGQGSSPVMLRRSGSFRSPGNSTGKSADSSAEATGHQNSKRTREKSMARATQTDSDSERSSGKPVLKRRSSEASSVSSRSEADSAPKSRARKQSAPMSPESRQKLIRIAGVGAALLVLAGVFSYLTSGPPVITPTVQGGGENSFSNQPSGSAPAPNQGGDAIQMGETNSSGASTNRIRGAGSPPRRIGESADDPKGGTDATLSDTTSETAGSSGAIPRGK